MSAAFQFQLFLGLRFKKRRRNAWVLVFIVFRVQSSGSLHDLSVATGFTDSCTLVWLLA